MVAETPNLKFSGLPAGRIQEAFNVLKSVGAEIRSLGRQQRIANIAFETYQKWQTQQSNYIVLLEGKIVGLATLGLETLEDWPEYKNIGPVQMLRGLATHPEYHGRGIGVFAVKRLLERFGQEPIYLDCVCGFLPSYYGLLGFQVMATRMIKKVSNDKKVSYEICLMRAQNI